MGQSTNIFKKISQIYNTPKKVQKLIRSFNYNSEPQGETCCSALTTWRLKQAHCLEATFFAAAVMEHQNFKPLVMSLESQDELDHVLFIFQQNNLWGAVSRSREEGLHGRSPVFKTVQDLALSYFDPFVDDSGRVTGYAVADLNNAGSLWRHSSKNVWAVEQFLINLKHKPLPKLQKRYEKLQKNFLKTGRPIRPLNFWW